MILLEPWLCSSALRPVERMRHIGPPDFQAVSVAQALADAAKINCCLLSWRSNSLTLFSNTFNTDSNYIARLQILRWVHTIADTSRCAGENDVARMQGHELAQVADDFLYTKHHVGSITLLTHLAIDFRPY